MDQFLHRFESYRNAADFEAAINLKNLVTIDDQNELETMPADKKYDLNSIRAVLLNKHKITPRKLGEYFKTLRPKRGDNISRLIQKMERALQEWLKAWEVGQERQDIIDFITWDQALSFLPEEMVQHFHEQEVKTLKKLCDVGDKYLMARPNFDLVKNCQLAVAENKKKMLSLNLNQNYQLLQ